MSQHHNHDPAATRPLNLYETQPLKLSAKEREALIVADRRSMQWHSLLSTGVRLVKSPVFSGLLLGLLIICWLESMGWGTIRRPATSGEVRRPSMESPLSAEWTVDPRLPVTTVTVEGPCTMELASNSYRVAGAYPLPIEGDVRRFTAAGRSTVKFQGELTCRFYGECRFVISNSQAKEVGTLEVSGRGLMGVNKNGWVSIGPGNSDVPLSRISCAGLSNLSIAGCTLVTVHNSKGDLQNCDKVLVSGRSHVGTSGCTVVSVYDSSVLYAEGSGAVTACDSAMINVADADMVEMFDTTSGAISSSRHIALYDRAAALAVNCQKVGARQNATAEYSPAMTIVEVRDQAQVKDISRR